MKLTPFAMCLTLLGAAAGLWAAEDAGGGVTFTPARFQSDVKAVAAARRGLAQTIEYLGRHPEVFPVKPPATPPALSRERRLLAWETWQSFLDRLLALDSLLNAYAALYDRLDGEARPPVFRLTWAAFLAQYRYALDFIEIAERNPALHTVLNEPVPELGLGGQTYAELKFRFLNVAIAAEFAKLGVVYRFYGADPQLELTAGIRADQDALWAAGQDRGPRLTAENALQIVKDTSFSAWFPVQKNVAEWMGDAKVWRLHRALVAPAQANEVLAQLEPGDVFLVRHEWFLSNLGLPGFWPHAALFVGTPEQRTKYFADPAVTAWVTAQGRPAATFEALLQAAFPEQYQAGQRRPADAPVPQIIEAKSEGVVFTVPALCIGDADSFAALRPRLPKLAKAQAIYRAFHYSGRPYDFNFDFLTDATLVCSELVYKAYEPGRDLAGGLKLPLVELMGRQVLPPNEIARRFDQDFGTAAQQFDLVVFLDGHEKEGVAVPADAAEFRRSWTRPKWHVFVQDDVKGQPPAR